MAYQFLMDGMLLPVTPAAVTMKVKGRNKTMTLINGEEINIVKSPGLTEISFDALLPNMQYPFAVYPDGFHNAKYYLTKLEEMKKKVSFPFQILRELSENVPLYNTEKDMTVTLEEYSIKEDAGQGFDVEVSIKLKQYQKYFTKLDTAEIKEVEDGAIVAEVKAERPATKEQPKGYTVVSGDCLWSICQKQLGDGARCWDIARLNGIPDPNKIYPGQVIRFE